MRRRTWLLGLVLLLGACDGDPPAEDAGVDAGTDGGEARIDAGVDAGSMDAGAADAGPGDAGESDLDAGSSDAGELAVDGGVPPMILLGAQVQADLADLTTAAAAVPMEERVDGAFADLDVAAGGIDALIGEDGLMTLALSDGAVRALADLRQANLLLEILDRAITVLTGSAVAEVVTTRTAAEALRARLAMYRDALAALFRERVDLGIVGTPIVDDLFLANLETSGPGQTARLPVVLEGSTALTGEVDVSLECFGGDGMVQITRFEVVDEETGLSLASTTGLDIANLTFSLPFDDVTPLTILIETVLSTPDLFDQCLVGAAGRRRTRVAQFLYGATMEVLDAQIALGDSISAFEMMVGVPPVGLDPATFEAALRQWMVILDTASPFRASDSRPIPVETLQETQRRIVQVRAMTDALIATPELAGTDALPVRTALESAMTAAEDLVVAVAP